MAASVWWLLIGYWRAIQTWWFWAKLTPEYPEICTVFTIDQADGLVQERRNSSALAVELRLSCTNPSKQCILLDDDIIDYTVCDIQMWMWWKYHNNHHHHIHHANQLFIYQLIHLMEASLVETVFLLPCNIIFLPSAFTANSEKYITPGEDTGLIKI